MVTHWESPKCVSDTVDLYGYNAAERQTFSDEERKGEKAGAMSLRW